MNNTVAFYCAKIPRLSGSQVIHQGSVVRVGNYPYPVEIPEFTILLSVKSIMRYLTADGYAEP